VFGTGGSRRAGEQAAAKRALEAVQNAFLKSTSSARKAKPRTSQLKLAGIATVQPDAPLDEDAKKAGKPPSKGESGQDAEQSAKPEIKHAPKSGAKADSGTEHKANSKAAPKAGTEVSSETNILPIANETKTA
jgi:ribonuclease-3